MLAIHHVAASVEVTTLQKRVLTELETAIDLLHPEKAEADAPFVSPTAAPKTAIVSDRTGYVARVRLESLVTSATTHGRTYRISALPGDYVRTGDTIVEANGSTPLVKGQSEEVLAAGTNDPYTAVSAVDALGGALATLGVRPKPSGNYRDDDGIVRVQCEWPSTESLIADTYLAIRTYGTDHPLVVRAAIDLSIRLTRAATADLRPTLRREIAALATCIPSTNPIDAAPIGADFSPGWLTSSHSLHEAPRYDRQPVERAPAQHAVIAR